MCSCTLILYNHIIIMYLCLLAVNTGIQHCLYNTQELLKAGSQYDARASVTSLEPAQCCSVILWTHSADTLLTLTKQRSNRLGFYSSVGRRASQHHNATLAQALYCEPALYSIYKLLYIHDPNCIMGIMRVCNNLPIFIPIHLYS